MFKSMIKLSLALAFLMTVAFAGQRWEHISTDVHNQEYYLDVTTVVRPDANTVIFWLKEVNGKGGQELQRVKMWKNRRFQRIDEPNYRIDDIPPETIPEMFYLRLFRGR